MQRTSVPIEKVQLYLNQKIDVYGKEEVARRIGFSNARLNEILTATRRDKRAKQKRMAHVSINQADKIAIKMDDHLMDIDPTLYE